MGAAPFSLGVGTRPGQFFDAYPGSRFFYDAFNQYGNELYGPQSGGQAQLAAGRAAEGPAMAFQGGMPGVTDPAQAQAMFAQLMGGNRAARGTGRGVKSQTQQGAMGGIADLGSAYGNDVISNIRAQYELEQAKANQNLLGMGLFSKLLSSGPGGLQSLFGNSVGSPTSPSAPGAPGFSSLMSAGSAMPSLSSGALTSLFAPSATAGATDVTTSAAAGGSSLAEWLSGLMEAAPAAAAA
jgi:hypothetical protein